MRSTNDVIFIKITSEYEDKIEGEKLTLDLMSFTKSIVDTETDEEIYNSLKHKRVWGEVLAVPERLSSTILSYQKYPGLPQPNRYVSHDMVQLHGTQLLQYDPSLWEPEYYKYCDIPMDVMPGDKIYYHFLSIEEESRIKEGGERVYKLPYQSAICIVRDGKITAVSGHCLIEAIYPEGAVDIGNNTKGFISKSGIVTQIGVKYTMQEGIVRHACKPFKGDEIDFKEGDHIIFKKYGDFIVNIEGKDFFVLKYWDAEGVLE